MFCWPFISKYARDETNLMYYLFSVYWVTTLLYVSRWLVFHHQEVAMYICLSRLSTRLDGMRYSIPSRPADSRLRRTTRTNCHIYTLLPPDDGLLANPKHIQVYWLNKLNINSASGWFHYTHNLIELLVLILIFLFHIDWRVYMFELIWLRIDQLTRQCTIGILFYVRLYHYKKKFPV
jgi:hypothetical protein